MALDIVYGYQGKDHVKASQLARLLSGTIGEGRYVLGTQNAMAATMQTANKVRIGTGDLVMDGRYITNEAYQELAVESGQSGYNRNDLVGVQYSRASGSDADHSVETVSLVVKKGTQTAGDATDPSYTAGDIAAGDASAFYPLWRLPITGLNVGTPVKLFEELEPYSDFRDSVSQLMYTTSKKVTVQASSYADVTFDVPGMPRGFMAIPTLATVGAEIPRYGDIALNVSSRTIDSVTVRVFNASNSGQVSPVVRIVCLSMDMAQ